MVNYAQALRAANTGYLFHIGTMHRAVDTAMLDWHGDAARAAEARAVAEAAAGDRIVAAVEALADEFESRAAELDGYRDVLLRIVDFEAPAAGIAVTDDGGVIPPPPTRGPDIGEVAVMLASRIAEQLSCFAAAEQRAAVAIAAAVAQLDAVSGRSDVVAPAPLPSDPVELHQAWQGLSPAERDTHFANDNYLGNRDGLPAVDRDRYNRRKLADELARAHAGEPGMVARLRDLRVVRDTIDAAEGRMLLVLDTQSGDQTRAAVAIGNPDTADHISVAAPGVNTTVADSFAGMAAEADLLRRTAEFELRSTWGREAETVATIAWIGYDTPQFDANDLFSRQAIDGMLDLAGTASARVAAPELDRFYDGLAAAHNGDPHLVAIGHSYGALVTGLALQQPGSPVIDDVLVYGSPGTGSGGCDDGLDRLQVRAGHAYEMTADHDVVAHLSRFGCSPGYQSGFIHLDTDAMTTPDGVPRDGARGHSEYPRAGSNGELRTSGYNAAVVVAELPELAILKP